MRISKQKLKQIIKEETQAELNEELLNEDWFGRLIKWLTGTTAGTTVLDRANKKRGMSQADLAYGDIPKR